MTKRLFKIPGTGRAGGKRHKQALSGNAPDALSKPAIRRLARRGGVKRINGEVYEHMRPVLRSWLGNVVKAAVIYAEHRRRMIVSLNDVLLALKHNGVVLYGFSERARKGRIMQRLPRERLQAAHERAVRRQAAAQREEQEQPEEEQAEQQQLPLAEAEEHAAPVAQQQEQQQCTGKEPAAAEPSSPGEAASPAPITPERALEIQASLCDLRDSMPRDSDPEVPLTRVLSWVTTDLRTKGRRACSELELSTVLTALEADSAVMLIEDAGQPCTVVFTT